eukprot:3891948-Heterocapsa_arctica.AAC.1
MIRVDHGHTEGPLAIGSYVEVTALNLDEMLNGNEHVEFMGDARGLPIALRLGIMNSIEALSPP